MNTVNDLYRRRQGQSPTACPPEPCVCGTCGQLECLCRPRFFAGQVLTADDLNRLDGYIRGKHRLHNRQLHGWGVVNGLEVTCNPCGDGVAVGCGYALSPCGDDIVVCEAVSVDVCELIRRCKDAETRWQQCEPPRQPPPGQCEDGEEEWILAIRYAEAPARGVKPLRPAPACDTGGCACGGRDGKCGCGGACGGLQCRCNGATLARPRGAPVQCEPTVICEGFAFEVYRKPAARPPSPDSPDNPDRPGQPGGTQALNPQSELMQRFRCCTELLVTQMPKLPGTLKVPATAAEAQAWYQWVGAARMQLRRYFGSHGSYHCELMAQFNAIPWPAAGTLAHAGAIYLAAVLLLAVWLDALLACFCSALLPPCPAPTREMRVPLASLHIAGGCHAQGCRVLRVCNWTVHRKFATTFPALQYWLGILPFGRQLRQLLENLCCFDVGGMLPPPRPGTTTHPSHYAMHRDWAPDMANGGAGGDGNGNGHERGGDPGREAANLEVREAHARYQHVNDLLNPTLPQPERIAGAAELLRAALARTGKTLEFGGFVDGMLGGGSSDRAAGRNGEGAAPLSALSSLSPLEAANLPSFLIANQLLRPTVAAALEPLLGAAFGFGGGLAATPGASGWSSAAGPTAAPETTDTTETSARGPSTEMETSADDITAIRDELAALRENVKAQAEQIERLKQAARATAKSGSHSTDKPASKRTGRKPG